MHTPVHERQAHVELWRGSGLSKAAYCREAGIPYHRLVSWCRKACSQADEANDGFDLLAVDAVLERTSRPYGLTVQVASATLLFTAGADPDWIARIVQAVTPC